MDNKEVHVILDKHILAMKGMLAPSAEFDAEVEICNQKIAHIFKQTGPLRHNGLLISGVEILPNRSIIYTYLARS